MESKAKSLISSSPLFESLTDTEIARIAGICREAHFKAGDQIFHENDRDTDLFLMPQGRVSLEISLGDETYTEQIHEAKDGEIFGELALLDGHRRSASARAREDLTLVAIARDDLDRIMDADHRIGYTVMKNLARIISGKLRETTIDLRNALMQQTNLLNRIY